MSTLFGFNIYTIEFKVNGEQISFDIESNLSDEFSLSLNEAVQSWVHRTKKYTAKSLCDYINSKILDLKHIHIIYLGWGG